MRSCFSIALTLLVISCAAEPRELLDPPRLTVLSPERALVREQPGVVRVTGTVAPNPAGERIAKVTVNGVEASVGSDGAFTAEVQLQAGATLLHTVARDVAGGQATDTRAVHAGARRSTRDLIDRGMAVALSDRALAAISSAAGPLMVATDFAPILAPLNPMVSAGADGGEDCFWGKVYIEDVNMSSARLSLAPRAGGLTFEVELHDLDVPGMARHRAACISGTTQLRIKAAKVLVTGTLQVSPRAGGAGFDVTVVSPNAELQGFDLQASGLPGRILEMLRLDNAIGGVIAKTAETFMSPLLNRALGALAGPKQLELAGQTLELEVGAKAVAFDVTGGQVDLDTRMGLKGADATFVSTPNDAIELAPGDGLAMAVSDDAANQLLASATAAGLINLSLPAVGGTFDTARVSATLPPMIAADGASGKVRLIAGDLRMTFVSGDTEVSHVALSLSTEVSASPTAQGVQLHIGAPEIFADVLDNASGYQDADKEQLIKLVVDDRVALLSLLFSSIPLPELAGLRLDDTEVSGGAGYIKLDSALR